MDQEFKPGQIVPESCASLNDLVGADRHFVTTNKPAEPGNIGCQDRHQLPFDCFCRHGAASPRQYIPTAAGQSNPPGARLNGQTKRPPESGEGSLELDQDLIGCDGLCRGGVHAIDGRVMALGDAQLVRKPRRISDHENFPPDRLQVLDLAGEPITRPF